MGPKVAVREPTVVEFDDMVEVAEEKVVVNLPLSPPVDDSKAIVVIEKLDVTEPANEKKPEGAVDRDRALARVETEKRMCLIKAWEDSKKSRAENKAQKKMSAIMAWENSKKGYLEAERKTIEEKLNVGVGSRLIQVEVK